MKRFLAAAATTSGAPEVAKRARSAVAGAGAGAGAGSGAGGEGAPGRVTTPTIAPTPTPARLGALGGASVPGVNPGRVQPLNTIPYVRSVIKASLGGRGAGPGGVVCYWMSREQRVQDNWALLYAQQEAMALGVPLGTWVLTPCTATAPVTCRRPGCGARGVGPVGGARVSHRLNVGLWSPWSRGGLRWPSLTLSPPNPLPNPLPCPPGQWLCLIWSHDSWRAPFGTLGSCYGGWRKVGGASGPCARVCESL
jgi:hypothetical protein